MTKTTPIDQENFRRNAVRNSLLPLILAVLLSILFVALIFQLVSTNKLLNDADRTIALGHEIKVLIIDAETGLRGYILTDDETFLTPYENSKNTFAAGIAELEVMAVANPAQLKRLQVVKELREKWLIYAQEIIRDRQDRQRVRDIISSEEGKYLIDQMRAALIEFIRYEEEIRDGHNEDSHNFVRLSLIIIITASSIVGLFLAFYLRRQVTGVASVYGHALEQSQQQTALLEKQNWLRLAQAKLGEELAGDLTLVEVSSKALNFLCEYLDAKVATLYSLEGDNLKLAATYAFNAVKTLNLNESLTGKAALEKNVLTLNPAPKDYLKVTSSTGEADVQAILIAPLVSSKSVKGVLEMGFLREIGQNEQELLELLSESIAIALTSAIYRERLQELLEESQAQAEELQAQQEELRVNNEELEEQSNALKESQVKLENQQAELEQTNARLNQQTDSLERKNLELGQARLELEAHARDLKKASEYKSQFLANMSHELRTPLNSTLILSQLLIDNKDQRLSEEEVEYARTILSSSNDLLALINDILDLSKVEAGKIELQAEDVEISNVIEGLEKTFSVVANNKDVEFETFIDESAPKVFKTDRLRLEQILRNLLSNAIKFTSKGFVKISATANKQGQLVLEVKDTGIGIPEDKQDLIFKAFQQADGTTNRQFGGTGLGLTISQDLAKLLGGEILVQSDQGKGSTFTLILSPMNESTEPEPVQVKVPVPQKEAQVRPHIHERISSPVPDDRNDLDSSLKLLMVVEDDESFARVMLDLSHEAQFQCLVSDTAEEAIRLAEEYLPHAIILDMKLPDHSGLFVLDRLKENPITRHIPIHIVSSMDFSKTALEMGAIGYLMKPAQKQEILDVIKKLEQKFTQSIHKVLIVEDNNVQRESMKKLIGDTSVEVMGVQTGMEAIDLLQSHSFDCLILDLSLPDMSGYEVLERMSQSEALSHPPVIVYTGHDLSREEEQRLQRYSRSIILKGAKSPERLLSEVSLFLHQVEADMPPERQKALRELRDREKDLEDKLILLVDDDVRNIFALKNALESRGARTEIARNGREAVDKVRSNPRIELVLMDIMMPVMNGYEAIAEIRKDQKFKNLPIIAVTAKAMADDQEKCLEAGADDYLPKPIDLPKLLSLIRVWLRPQVKKR